MAAENEGRAHRHTSLSRPMDAVGQLSFSPSTQTTVVTTTTTTTTSFPPFVLNAPHDLKARDPEVFPLAAITTPTWLKKLSFSMGDQLVHFEEVDDAEQTLAEYNRQQADLRSRNGVLKTVRSTNKAHITEGRRRTPRPTRDLEELRKQSETPISLADDSRLQDADALELDSFHAQHTHPPALERTSRASSGLGSGRTQQTLSTLRSERSLSSTPLEPTGSRRGSSHGLVGAGGVPRTVKSSTSPNRSSEEDVLRQPQAMRVALGSIETTSAQDASLPSPSLSPITAAAQGRHLPSSRLRDAESTDSEESDYFHDTVGTILQRSDIRHDGDSSSRSDALTSTAAGPTISDVPRVLDTFDAMPETLQSYVMYQLLRRCSKKTLHFVADAVSPALKVDFLKRLPLELRQQITSYLDVQSMCRAARVSKHWRQVVDRDEKAWWNLIMSDNMKIPPGEVMRAVDEGWGWQFPRHDADWEVDLSKRYGYASKRRDVTSQSTGDPAPAETNDATSLKRKRTDDTQPAPSNKRIRYGKGGAVDDDDCQAWLMHPDRYVHGIGPHALSKSAEALVPNPKFGLRSLRQVALFKSLYRRHYRIRQSWLKPDTKPKHVAFRAHEGHVITCLQFDNDKILTGSDDAIIDIYDTATGAQRRRLTGHEGGVWALEYQDNLLVSGSTDRSVRIWNMDTGKCLHIFQGHTSTVRCLQIIQPVQVGLKANGAPLMMPPERLIVTGSRDSSCRVWKLPKPEDRSIFQHNPNTADDNPFFVRALAGHTHSVRAIAAHGDTLVSGSYDNTVKVWQPSTGETLHTLRGHTTKVYSVVLDHKRKRCISGSMDTIVKVWSIETGECLFNLNGHNSLVGLLDLQDNVLVSAAADWTLRTWDPESGRNLHTLKAHNSAITCFAHDYYKVVSGSEKSLKMWNTQTGECVRDLLTDLRGVWQVRFDERRCIAAVHRGDWTYIEVLDFGAAADGVPECDLGRRIVVDAHGQERLPDAEEAVELDEDDDVEEGVAPVVIQVDD